MPIKEGLRKAMRARRQTAEFSNGPKLVKFPEICIFLLEHPHFVFSIHGAFSMPYLCLISLKYHMDGGYYVLKTLWRNEEAKTNSNPGKTVIKYLWF